MSINSPPKPHAFVSLPLQSISSSITFIFYVMCLIMLAFSIGGLDITNLSMETIPMSGVRCPTCALNGKKFGLYQEEFVLIVELLVNIQYIGIL